MASATARAPQPGNEKGHAFAGHGLSVSQINGISAETHILSERRVQRLISGYGLSERRARIAADMVWGASNV